MDVSKIICDRESQISFEVINDGKTVQGLLHINLYLADLLGSQYLFEILQTSRIIKNSDKKGIFRKTLAIERSNFFWMSEGYKVSCVKILIFC